MATVAITMDNNDGTRDPHDIPPSEMKFSDRWIARGSTFLTIWAGNGSPKTTPLKIWQILSRFIQLIFGPSILAKELLWPCEGKPQPCPESMLSYGICAVMIIGVISLVLIGVRTAPTSEYTALLRKERGTFSYKHLPAIRAVICVFLLLSLLGGQIPSPNNSLGRIQADEDLQENPALRAKVMLAQRLTGVCFLFMFANGVDGILNAVVWLGTTRYTIKQFANDVCALSGIENGKVLDLEAGENKVAPATGIATPVHSDQIGDDSITVTSAANVVAVEAASIGSPLISPTAFHTNRRAAQASVKRSFLRASKMNAALNSIFAFSLSAMFTVFVLIATMMWPVESS